MAEKFDGSPLAWIKRVLETRNDEISCTQCQDLVSGFVDMELESGEAAVRMPQLVRHLGQCPACWDTYQVLRELAQLEGRGELPSIEELVKRLKR
jgi:hypothetical protein